MGLSLPLILNTRFDPFGGAEPRLLRRGKEVPLRVNLLISGISPLLH